MKTKQEQPTDIAEELKQRIKDSGSLFVYDQDDEANDEYAHFYFQGKHEGKEVIYDTVMYTLRLEHESEIFEIAEEEAAKHFPEYERIRYQEDEDGNMKALNDQEEEIGLFMAEIMQELEEEGAIKVKEHIDLDVQNPIGIGLDVGLNLEKISTQVIEKFIRNYNSGALKLDETLYSFQTGQQL